MVSQYMEISFNLNDFTQLCALIVLFCKMQKFKSSLNIQSLDFFSIGFYGVGRMQCGEYGGQQNALSHPNQSVVQAI